MIQKAPTRCSLAQCAGCTFRFFDSRLTPDEVEKLYSGYRGDEYFRHRHATEPWYTRRINDGIGADPEEIDNRNASLEEFVSKHLNLEAIGTVLDYGGDKGQFIPSSLGRQKFVFELSSAKPVTGVTRLRSESELNRRFDLLLLLGVLEHCSEPLQILQKLRPLLGAESNLVIGVPYEWYSLNSVSSSRLYLWYLSKLMKCGPLLKLIDVYSTAFRVRANSIPPFGFLKCHEHLNFFNQQSISALLQAAGLELVACSTSQTCTYPARTLSLNVLARLKR